MELASEVDGLRLVLATSVGDQGVGAQVRIIVADADLASLPGDDEGVRRRDGGEGGPPCGVARPGAAVGGRPSGGSGERHWLVCTEGSRPNSGGRWSTSSRALLAAEAARPVARTTPARYSDPRSVVARAGRAPRLPSLPLPSPSSHQSTLDAPDAASLLPMTSLSCRALSAGVHLDGGVYLVEASGRDAASPALRLRLSRFSPLAEPIRRRSSSRPSWRRSACRTGLPAPTAVCRTGAYTAGSTANSLGPRCESLVSAWLVGASMPREDVLARFEKMKSWGPSGYRPLRGT